MDNYNHLYLSGDKVWTDNKYCQEMGLDPSLAGTPEINKQYIEKNPDKRAHLERLFATHGYPAW